MARKDRLVRRVDERNPNAPKGGGQLIQRTPIAQPTKAIIQPPPPEDVTIGTQTLTRTTYTPKVLVNVTWSAPNNLLPDHYMIQYAKDVNFTNPITRTTTTREIALEMDTNTAYWVRVQACVQTLYSAWAYPNDNAVTAALTTINDTTPPAAATSLSGTWQSGDLHLSWMNPTSTNYFQSRVRIYSGGTLYREVFVVGNPGSQSRYIFTLADNASVSGGAYLKSVTVNVTAMSLTGVTAPSDATGTFSKAAPSAPTGLTSSWVSDNGTAPADVIITWNAVAAVKDYVLTIDGKVYTTTVPQFVYTQAQNAADHQPSQPLGDPVLTLALRSRDHLDQTSSTSATGTAVNAKPATSNFTVNVTSAINGITVNVTQTIPTQDFSHYIWQLQNTTTSTTTSGQSISGIWVLDARDGTYNVSVRAVDVFGQQSDAMTTTGLVHDGLTLEELRADAYYTDISNRTQAQLDLLKDDSTSTNVTYSIGSTWNWINVERPYTYRFRNAVLSAVGGYSTATKGYIATSTDGTTWSYFSGPLTGGVLTAVANETAARTAAVNLPINALTKWTLPAYNEARHVRLWHINQSASGTTYGIQEFYPRRLVQSDDIEAEAIQALHIAANAVTADKINVATLSAITANIGGLTINSGGYIWQGTGTAGSPTTGLLIDQSGGVGRLRTFNSGVMQVSLDTDGTLKAGAGSVRLSSAGIAIHTSSNAGTTWFPNESLQYFDTSTGNLLAQLRSKRLTDINGIFTGVLTQLTARNISGVGSGIEITSFGNNATTNGYSYILLQAQRTDASPTPSYIRINEGEVAGGYTRRIELGTGTVQIDAQSTIDLNSTGLVRISNGVNIGSPSTNATAGGLSVAGAVRVENPITVAGSNAIYYFTDRTTSTSLWALYANSGNAYIYHAGTTTNHFALDTTGRAAINKSLSLNGSVRNENHHIRIRSNIDNSTDFGIIYKMADDTANNFQVQGNGDGFLRAAAWTYGSDVRWKTNIRNIAHGIDALRTLQPRLFDYVDELQGRNVAGFIAQEMQESKLSDLVSVVDESGYLGVKTTNIIPYLVKAVQELADQLEALQSAVGKLSE